MYDDRVVATLKALILKTAISRAKGKEKCVFQSGSFYKLLKQKTPYSSTDLHLALEHLLKEGFMSCRYTKGPFELHGMVTVEIPAQELPQHERDWSQTLQLNCNNENDRNALNSAGAKLKGFSKNEMTLLLSSFYKLREDQSQLTGKALYDISAQYLLGSSKLLTTLQVEAKQFGIDLESFSPSYRYISVAGRTSPEAVIIVENPHCFETAVKSDHDLQYSWISSYGFGISLDKELKYGELLVNNISQHSLENTVMLTRKGTPDSLVKLLSHPKLFFWGDLDFGGLQIFQQLKKSLPNLRLSGIYHCLVKELQLDNAHPYSKAVAKDGQKIFSSDDFEIQELLKLCRHSAVDQESIKGDDIMRYAGREY